MLKLAKSLIVLLSVAALSFTSCEKSNDPYKPAPAPSGGSNMPSQPVTYLSMRIKNNNSDTSWKASAFSYTTYYKGTDSAYSILSGDQKILIKIPVTEGYYSLGRLDGRNRFWAKLDGVSSESGELRVSFIDKAKNKVSGIFSFKIGSIIVYEGKFVNVPEK